MSRARDIADFGSVSARLDTVGGSSGALSNRSLVHNGDMRIDQRNGGSAVTADGNTKFPVDRFFVEEGSDGVLSGQQVSDAPDGFLSSLKVTVSTADTSLSASQLAIITHRVEGQNIQHLNWGSSSAKTVTLSFWVKCSLTGTFGGSFWNNAFDRSYPYTYTISSANTWEYKTVTVQGPTDGTWLTTNGRGVSFSWSLGAGSSLSGTAGSWQSSGLVAATGGVSVIGTTSATFQITGVQLEVGDTATDFEHRSFGDEVLRCQRYYNEQYYRYEGVFGASGNGAPHEVSLPIAMRAAPTLSNGTVTKGGDVSSLNSLTNFTGSSLASSVVVNLNFSGTGNGYIFFNLIADAEL